MSYYFKTKKLDISAGDPLVVVVNSKDAHEYGLHQGGKVHMCWKDICLYVAVDFSDSVVNPGEIGMFAEVWEKYRIPADDIVSLDIPHPPKSMESIRKKLRGESLTYDEIYQVMDDITNRRLSSIEMTYFAASSYNPGFNEQEIYYLTKAMAETGDILDFSDGDPSRKVIDKHSIGGIPAKGVTPVLVSICACFDGVVLPNTSSRAITTPAGTSDMLEVVMPVTLSKEEIMRVVREENACLVWGGSFDLAPADDFLINIERPLNIESHDKFLVSIVAKKAAMKLTHLLVDVPYGEGAKVIDKSEVEKVDESFRILCEKFGIKLDVYTRESMGPDGYGVGPTLEMRDLLRIFERHERRPKILESVIIDMTGRLLELADVVPVGKGASEARSKLESGEAEEKFWSIAMSQGAEKKIRSEDLILAEFTHEVKAEKSGIISRIGNREVVDIARGLGAPFIKEAGMYFHKLCGEEVKAGETVFTMYATSEERLEVGMEVMERVDGNMVKY